MSLVRAVVVVLAAALIGLLGGQGQSAALPTATAVASAIYSHNSNHSLLVAAVMTAQRRQQSETDRRPSRNTVACRSAVGRFVGATPSATTPRDHPTTAVRVASAAATASGFVIAAEGVESGLTSAARTCSVNSFTAATLITMADGSKKPIKAVEIGEQVLATDPETGETASRPVTKLIRHGGKHTMVDVRLADGSVISATDHHPFWDATTGEFTYAIDLRPGHRVRQIDGTPLAVAAIRVYDQDLTAYNLTVDGIHTYYAGATPVLVHNSCGGSLFRFGREPESAANLGADAAKAEANGFPHGVSVRSRTNRSDAMEASREAVEGVFNVIKTGKDPAHYTVELPNPVTQDVADLFNTLFGRL